MKGLVWLIVLSLVFVSVVPMELFAAQEQVKCRVKGDPILIGGASLLIPGLGQFFNGQDGKGLTHLIVALALPTLVLLAATFVVAVSPLSSAILVIVAPLLYLGWAVNSAIDAYGVAATYCKP